MALNFKFKFHKGPSRGSSLGLSPVLLYLTLYPELWIKFQ